MKRVLCAVMAAVLLIMACGCEAQRVSNQPYAYVLIDPGHGGFDGGAVASDGTNEKQINLAISLVLKDMLSLTGIPVQMTRQTDDAVGEIGADKVREKKVADMRNRLALYEGASLVVSVHQNHFSVEKYRGTQVFYSVNHPDSVLLAEHLQQSVIAGLQPDNNRQIKPATDGIYLLHHTTVPAVLVECGFLSNANELEQLKQPAYQQQMAFALLCGFWNCTKEK